MPPNEQVSQLLQWSKNGVEEICIASGMPIKAQRKTQFPYLRSRTGYLWPRFLANVYVGAGWVVENNNSTKGDGKNFTHKNTVWLRHKSQIFLILQMMFKYDSQLLYEPHSKIASWLQIVLQNRRVISCGQVATDEVRVTR